MVQAVLLLEDGVVEMTVVGTEIEEMEVEQEAVFSLETIKEIVVSSSGIVRGVEVGVVVIATDLVVCQMVHRTEDHMRPVEGVMYPAYSTCP